VRSLLLEELVVHVQEVLLEGVPESDLGEQVWEEQA
jgi:hypothetical protein